MKTCPKCKLYSPDNAERCDCGWDFITESRQLSYIADTREWQMSPWSKRGASFGWKIAVFGAGMGWYLARPQVDPAGGELMGISEAEFIKGLMAGTSALLGFSLGFVIGALRKTKRPKFDA